MIKLHPRGFTAAACLLIGFGGAPLASCNGCCLHYQTTTFSVPTALNTEPTSINSSNAVAGLFQEQFGYVFGFVRDPDGAIFTFAAPGNNQISLPVYINDSGVVAGTYRDAYGVVHGLVGNPKIAGGIVSIDPPGSSETLVTGINASGTICHYHLARNVRLVCRQIRADLMRRKLLYSASQIGGLQCQA